MLQLQLMRAMRGTGAGQRSPEVTAAAGVRGERTQLIHSTDSHNIGARKHLCTWERKLPTELFI